MERGNELRAAIVMHAAAQPRDRIERAQQRARGERAERDDHLRLDGVDLLEQERFAGLDLVLLRIAIARRTALDDVRDVDILAPQPDRLDDLREQLARGADERKALDV